MWVTHFILGGLNQVEAVYGELHHEVPLAMGERAPLEKGWAEPTGHYDSFGEGSGSNSIKIYTF